MGKIYTKIGDRGTTRLLGGLEVPKYDPRLEAYGSLDELNSFIGSSVLAIQSLASTIPEILILANQLVSLQHRLFVLGSFLACESNEMKAHLPPWKTEWISELETQIDQLDSQMPKLTEFILPGGSKSATDLHLCRTVCRRSERRISELQLAEDPILLSGQIYINRLSDFFFVASRFVNFKQNIPDETWKK